MLVMHVAAIHGAGDDMRWWGCTRGKGAVALHTAGSSSRLAALSTPVNGSVVEAAQKQLELFEQQAQLTEDIDTDAPAAMKPSPSAYVDQGEISQLLL